MKSFKTSFSNLSHTGSSSANITLASTLADQCSKTFDQLAALLTNIRNISTPENVLVIEQGLVKANDSGIGATLAEKIRLSADNCSRNDRETIQSALSEATACINTCCEVAKKAQKKKKLDKDPQKKVEQSWYLFCRELINISKLLPLSKVDLQSIHSLCEDDSDLSSVLEGQGHLRSYHTIESRNRAHHRTSSASRSGSSNRSQASHSSTRKLQKHKSHASLMSSPPAYSDIVKAKHDEKDDEKVDEVLPLVPASRPSLHGISSGSTNPPGLFPSYPCNNHNINAPLPQSVGFMGPMPPAILVPIFPQPYLQPQYPPQPQWPYPPPSISGAYKSGSSKTEFLAKFALDVVHPELKCPCHVRHFGDHPRCLRNCCIWMGCV